MNNLQSGASPVLLIEHWKPVVGFEPYYEVSNVGNLRKRTGRMIMAYVRPKKYKQTTLHVKGKSTSVLIHQIVAVAFLGACPVGLEVNHINGWRISNRVSNLEYTTRAKNIRHAVVGNKFSATRFAKKLSDDQVIEIRRLTKTNRLVEIAKDYGVSVSLVVS